jgi:hypothetical protein
MGVMKDDVDYSVFTWEGQYYLAQIRGGCPGGEQQALEMTLQNYPHVSEFEVRGWAREPVFHRALKDARERGKENREYDEMMAARRSQDPFSGIPPRGGMDLAAETFDASTPKPPGALSRFLRRLGVEIDFQHAQRQEPRPPGQREISLDEMTDRDWAAVRYQGAEAQRVRAEQGLEGQKPIGRWTPPGVVWRVPGVQQWDGTGISPDGTRVEQ